jgi:hypothetical protein
VIEFPEAFTVSANPTLGRSIAGCDVTATVQKPDGTSDVIELRDSGTVADGDPDDGLYAVQYSNFTAGDGLYTFVVRTRCEETVAQTVGPKEPTLAATAVTPAAAAHSSAWCPDTRSPCSFPTVDGVEVLDPSSPWVGIGRPFTSRRCWLAASLP